MPTLAQFEFAKNGFRAAVAPMIEEAREQNPNISIQELRNLATEKGVHATLIVMVKHKDVDSCQFFNRVTTAVVNELLPIEFGGESRQQLQEATEIRRAMITHWIARHREMRPRATNTELRELWLGELREHIKIHRASLGEYEEETIDSMSVKLVNELLPDEGSQP